jgi:PAS domain S-box-containing protein
MLRVEQTENLLKAALVGSILVLSIIAGFTFSEFRAVADSQQLVTDSYQRQALLHQLQAALNEGETNARAYILTGETIFLENYNISITKIDSAILQLNTTYAEHNAVQEKFTILKYLVDQRIQNIAINLQLFVGENTNEAYNTSVIKGNELLQEIKRIIGGMLDYEKDVLIEKENINTKKKNQQPLYIFITVLFSLLVFTISYFVLVGNLRRRMKSLHRLKINNTIFNEVEKISDSSHWYFDLSKKTILFSKNFLKLLGVEADIIVPKLSFLIRIVIREDRELVLQTLKDLKNYGEMKELKVRIKTSKGESKTLILVTCLLKDEYDRDIIIGAQKDITEENTVTQELFSVNQALQLQNNFFKNAEEIAETGSYSYVFSTGKSGFSDNLFRILGYEPNSFSASAERLFNAIHPDDLPDLFYNLGLEQKIDKISQGYFRIIEKSGNIKFLASRKKMLNTDARKTLIVTFKDVTEEIMISKRLEEKNLELSNSIEELDSFNHIASHDLQEPLRKIQTFISRLKVQKELEESPVANDYMERIQKSSNRMQKLILDLLTFSRISKGNKNFVLCKLSMILDEAVHETKENINEKNATIHYDNLPEVEVISFQIQQLFVNLISNSLKYSKSDVNPHIHIKRGTITSKDRIRFSLTREVHYYKIIFEDNGIGFEQQYAETIFILFQRLHDKSQYSGTGIGLAICKKIVDNHRGFIYAESILGQGSRFSILLPKPILGPITEQVYH